MKDDKYIKYVEGNFGDSKAVVREYKDGNKIEIFHGGKNGGVSGMSTRHSKETINMFMNSFEYLVLV